MKTLGLIGGMSWVSTIDYYKLINEGINEQLGGLNFSQCIIYSFNYADVKKNNDANDWDANFKMVAKAGEHLKNAGAAAIILCANTMHLIAEKIEKEINLPVIHIATATATAIQSKGINKVGLLGTKFTMELDFFTSKLKDKGIEAIIPSDEDRHFIHCTIFEELGRGLINDETKARYLAVIQEMMANGAEGIILGCTEIPLLIQPKDVPVPVFDTARIHAAAAVSFALS
jgi:aspartate racemase